MVAFIRQRDIAFAGVDLLYDSDEPLAWRPHGEHVASVRGIRPLAFGFAFGERSSNSAITIYRFVVEQAEPGVFAALAEVFRSSITFVGHDLRLLLSAFWKLGLPEPRRVWDTLIAARAMCLGMHHNRYLEPTGGSVGTAPTFGRASSGLPPYHSTNWPGVMNSSLHRAARDTARAHLSMA